MIRLFSALQISQSYTPGNNAELSLGENHGYLLGAFWSQGPTCCDHYGNGGAFYRFLASIGMLDALEAEVFFSFQIVWRKFGPVWYWGYCLQWSVSLSDSDFLTPLLKRSRWSLFIIVLSGFRYRTVLSVNGWPHATADLRSYQGRPAGCAISPLCPLCVIAAWPERDPTGHCGPDAYLNLVAAALNLPQLENSPFLLASLLSPWRCHPRSFLERRVSLAHFATSKETHARDTGWYY